MERFVEAFEEAYPEAGAVMAANFNMATLDGTFSVDADDARSAVEIGTGMFCDIASKTGIAATEIIEIRASLVHTPEHEQVTGELALAR
jgi:hypothetical protein